MCKKLLPVLCATILSYGLLASSYEPHPPRCVTDAVHFFFTDMTGTLREIIYPCHYTYDPITKGIVFDGSSIPGYRSVDESDQGAMPEAATTGYLRVTNTPQAYIFCDACEDGEAITTDSRTILKQSVNRALQHGYTMSVGAEIEFFLMHPDGSPADTFGYCQACDDIQVYKMLQGLVQFLNSNNIPAEKLHNEVGQGQYEIVLHHDNPVAMADYVMLARHLIKLFASEYGLIASFKPKPYTDRNGSAMHIHFSISDAETGTNVFIPEGNQAVGPIAQNFMAGVLNRVHAGAAFLNPTHNSFDRLQPGYEAPVAICWSLKNRSALIRLPEVGNDKQSAARAEIRSPDSSSNPYLVFSFLLHAGIDGIKNNEELAPAITTNVYHMSEAERAEHNIRMLPISLDDALTELSQEQSLRDAFGSDYIDRYIEVIGSHQ